jgi:ribonuclease P protein component
MLRARYKNVNRDLTEKNQENWSERRTPPGIRKKVENVEDVEKRGKFFGLSCRPAAVPQLDPIALSRLISSAHLGGSSDEAIVSPAEQASHHQAWISRPDGHPVGPSRPLSPAQEGPQASHCLVAIEARRLLTPSARYPRAVRLARASDIRRCLAHGRRRRLEHLDLIWMDNHTGHPRMGLIVPKFQTSAVARNRLRRRLKEIWRQHLQSRLPAHDLVIRARREAYQASFDALRRQLLGWADVVQPQG